MTAKLHFLSAEGFWQWCFTSNTTKSTRRAQTSAETYYFL